ncbi:MAG: methyltransferase family protein [Thermoguttaceae bacterium]
MSTEKKRKLPPIWMFIVFFVTIYTAISFGLTSILKLPWHVSLPHSLAIALGAPLLALGLAFDFWAVRTLSFKRALGKELFLDKSESQLITSGPYAYTRNPIYLAVLIALVGCFFLSRLTALGLLAAFFAVHFTLVAKWEERELKQRFGQEYIEYARRVPLFFPCPRCCNREKSNC